jgi:hypothetical protein
MGFICDQPLLLNERRLGKFCRWASFSPLLGAHRRLKLLERIQRELRLLDVDLLDLEPLVADPCGALDAANRRRRRQHELDLRHERHGGERSSPPPPSRGPAPRGRVQQLERLVHERRLDQRHLVLRGRDDHQPDLRDHGLRNLRERAPDPSEAAAAVETTQVQRNLANSTPGPSRNSPVTLVSPQ